METTETYDPIPYRNRGAALLDERVPDWMVLMPTDLDRLDTRSCRRCVLGHLSGCGDYGIGVDLVLPGAALSQIWAVGHGFDVPHPGGARRRAAFAALTDSWRELITARRAQAVPS